MKKRKLIVLLTSLTLLSVSACGKTTQTESEVLTDSVVPVESIPAIEGSEAVSESSDNYVIQTTQQDISYQAPTGNAELASMSLQLLNISGKETAAVQKINEIFAESYQNSYELISGENPEEGDFVSDLPAYAYEQYVNMDSSGNGEYFSPYYFATSYSVQRIDDSMFSSLEMTDTYTGGAHGSHLLAGLNYDMQTGEQVTVSDLSNDPDTFFAYCTEQLLSQADEMQSESNVFFEDYRDNITQIITDQTFYFSKEGLCFLSTEYMLQPYAAGTITFCIPYENLKGYLKDEYFPDDASWDFTVNSVTNDPVVYTYQVDFANDVVTPMLDSFLSWTGLLYFYGNNTSLDSLTQEAALSMAGFAIIYNYAYDESWYDEYTGSYALPTSLVDSYTQNYFGKTYDIPSFQRSENYPMVCGSETGDLLVQVGDWGTMAPTYEINEVTENADQTRTVSVDYYSFDYENDEQSDVLATATYTFAPNSDSTFGYAITDMKFTQK